MHSSHTTHECKTQMDLAINEKKKNKGRRKGYYKKISEEVF